MTPFFCNARRCSSAALADLKPSSRAIRASRSSFSASRKSNVTASIAAQPDMRAASRISDMAWRSIDGKLSAVFADLGAQARQLGKDRLDIEGLCLGRGGQGERERSSRCCKEEMPHEDSLVLHMNYIWCASAMIHK